MTDELKVKADENLALHNRVQKLEDECDSLEQYTRRNSLRISEMEETDDEDPYQLALQIIEKLKLDELVTIKDIDRCHHIGPKTDTDQPRQIIVKFATNRIRQKAYQAKKELNSTDLYLSEDLTKKRATLLYEARKRKRNGDIKGCWTYDGVVRIKDNHGKTIVIHDEQALTRILTTHA
jgi:exosome complex exonuclease DIS3/RRP44